MRVDSVVCWKWSKPGYRSSFSPDTVNVLRRMVARHYPVPHRFICVTDDPVGLDSDVEVVDLWPDLTGIEAWGAPRNPNCYPRLRLFHPDAAQWFGERFVSVDLDTVVTGDLTPIFERPEPVVLWGNTHPTTHYNGSFVLLSAGARPAVWTTFDPETSPALAREAGQMGSDQGWVSYCLGAGEAMWTTADGVYSYRNHIRSAGDVLPLDARIVSFHGQLSPWDPVAERMEWVQRCYC